MNEDETIHAAASRGDLNKVRDFISCDPSLINAMDKDMRTPLHKAAAALDDRADLVAYLISCGADVKARDKDGWTPYDWADFIMNRDVLVLLEQSTTV